MKHRWLIITGVLSAVAATIASVVAAVLSVEKHRTRRYIELA